MSTRPIRLTLFDHTDVEGCAVHCEMSSPASAGLDIIKAQLEEDFEDGVVVEYVDLAQPQQQALYGDMARRVKTENLLMPIIAIDGVPKLSGNVDYRTIVETIETYKELIHG